MMMNQHDAFQRPAVYWLKRAERQKQTGNLLRAAVLERHALRADESSDEAWESYVLTLRQLNCYEASNREAFAALAHSPARRELYGLIGQNMLAMGLRPAGVDALNIYLATPIDGFLPLWHDDAYDLACMCDTIPPRRRKARLDGLLARAARCIATDRLDKAKAALTRAGQKPYQGPSAQRELLWALYELRKKRRDECLERMLNAIRIRPRSAQIHASAANIFHSLGMKDMALMELVNASRFAVSPAQMLAVLMVSDVLRAPHIVCGMLRRMLKHQANRFPVLYNLCVCMLRLGKLDEAARCIHHCREIDPDDVSGELLFSRVMAMQENGLTPAQVRRAGRSASWYGACSPQELSAVVAPIMAALADGPKQLAEAICEDRRLRLHFLHLLSMPLDWPARLLAAVGESLPDAQCERLMREVLLQHPGPSAAKLHAVSKLHQLGVQPPYATWQDDRIAWADPTRKPQETPAFRPRMLTKRIHRAQKLCPHDRGIALWAMEVVHRMSRGQRSQLIADPARIWPLALAIRYRYIRGMEPLHIDLSRLGRGRAWALNDALRLLRTVK